MDPRSKEKLRKQQEAARSERQAKSVADTSQQQVQAARKSICRFGFSHDQFGKHQCTSRRRTFGGNLCPECPF